MTEVHVRILDHALLHLEVIHVCAHGALQDKIVNNPQKANFVTIRLAEMAPRV